MVLNSQSSERIYRGNAHRVALVFKPVDKGATTAKADKANGFRAYFFLHIKLYTFNKYV